MEKFFLSIIILVVSSFQAQASVLTLDFDISNMYIGGFINGSNILMDSDSVSGKASLSFDLDKYSNSDISDIRMTNLFFYDNIDVDSPLQNLIYPYIVEGSYSIVDSENYAHSYTSDLIDFFYEGFDAHFYKNYIDIAASLQYMHWVDIEIVTHLVPRNMDGTSDYELSGQYLIDYFSYLKNNNIFFSFHDYFYITNYATGRIPSMVNCVGNAYISSISYSDNVITTPEPSALILLGIGVMGFLGIGRLRRI